MKILKIKPIFLYGVSGLAVAIIFFVLNISLPEKSFIHSFLFRCWPIQFLNSLLFSLGLLYWAQRYSFFKKEEETFQRVKLPEFSIRREKAEELIKTMPDEARETLTLRRFREILQAFLYGEDIIRLNEELSRRDMAEVERGHLILSTLRGIVPVIGFLGTVIGLSLGMTKFPEVADVDITAIRDVLKDFAASLSVAFDTTLLALGYTILIILLSSFLRKREETLVSKVNERARILLGKLRVESTPHTLHSEKGIEQLGHILNNVLIQWKEEFSFGMNRFLEKLSYQNSELNRQQIEKVGKILAEKFEEIKEGIHYPPRYQVIVQPLEEKKDEEQ